MEKNHAQYSYLYKRKIQRFLHTSCGFKPLQPMLVLVLAVSNQSKNAARVTGRRGSRVVEDLVLPSRGSPSVAASFIVSSISCLPARRQSPFYPTFYLLKATIWALNHLACCISSTRCSSNRSRVSSSSMISAIWVA
jgi:hypothetical protein